MTRKVIRSPKGIKYYAVWDSKDKFVKVQLYKNCHSMDIKRKSKAEKTKRK